MGESTETADNHATRISRTRSTFETKFRQKVFVSASFSCLKIDAGMYAKRASKILSSPVHSLHQAVQRSTSRAYRTRFDSARSLPPVHVQKSETLSAGYTLRPVDADAACRQHELMLLFLWDPQCPRHSSYPAVGSTLRSHELAMCQRLALVAELFVSDTNEYIGRA